MPDNLSGRDTIENDKTSPEQVEEFLYFYDSAADSGDPPPEARKSRSRIREAIRSVYGSRPLPTPEPEPEYTPPPEPILTPDRNELARLIHAQVDAMVEEARELAHNSQKEQALRILSHAVRIDPDHSMAWTWLGGLLIDRNPERALYCLERAYTLDPDNIRAEKGLEYIHEVMYPPEPEQLEPEILEQPEYVPVPEEMALVKVEDEQALLVEQPDPSSIKIGISEALEIWREKYPDLHVDDLPVGGAQVTKPRWRRSRKKKTPQLHHRLKLSIGLLLGLMAFSILSMWILVARPNFEAQPTPIPTLTPVPAPTSTPLPSAEETYAVRLRGQLERYNSFLERSKELYRQFDAGKLRWEELKKGYHDLQGEIKDQKKRVDELAGPTTPQLLTVYKGLQEISLVSITAINYMVSGIDNISDEDLNEGTRQLTRVNGLLVSLVHQLDTVAPLPTPALTLTPDITRAPTPSN
jgi:tetratricopeptide (TPR) repeat protein